MFRASIFALAMIWFLGACGESKSLDKFLGPAIGDNEEPKTNYILEFEPATWDFLEILTTATTTESKRIVVKNPTLETLFIASVSTNVSTHFALKNNTCAILTAGLAAGQTCEFTVEFKPLAAGAFSYNVAFVFGLTAGDTTKNSVFTAVGVGATPALIMISDGPTFDYGATVLTATNNKTYTLTNSGSFPAKNVVPAALVLPFEYRGGAYPGTGGTCTTQIAGSGSCTVVVSFRPTSTGLATSTISLDYDTGQALATATRPMQGTGATAASLSITDSPFHDFGTIPVGGFAEKTLTVTNSGGVTATVVAGSGLTAPYTFKGGVFPGTGGTCGATIPSAGTCDIVVRYAPTAAGVTLNTLIVGYNNGLVASTSTRDLTGTAVTPALLAIDQGPTFNFGSVTVGSTVEQTFTVTNTGGFGATTLSPVALTAPYAFKGGTFPGTGGNCGTSLSAGSLCTVVVTFAPTAAGPTNDTIRVNYYSGVANLQATRAIQGTGLSPALLVLSNSPSYDFGTRPTGSSTDVAITVQNTGGSTATVVVGTGLTTPYTFKGGTYPGTGGTCAATLASAASCTIVANYSPVSTGVQTDSIDVNYFDGSANQLSSRTLLGNAVGPAVLSISDGPTYDYGTQPIGLDVDKSFIVTNTGGFIAASVSGTGLSAPFTFKGGSFPGTGGTCAAALAAGATCTMTITYNAVAAVASANTASISYDSGVATVSATRDVTGTGVPPALLSISDGPTYDFGTAALSTTAEKTFTVTNTGSFSATSITGTAFTAPFLWKGTTFPGTGGTCGGSLAPAAACTVVVVFAPTTSGNHSGTLQLGYSNGLAVVTSSRPVQGIGTSPAQLTVSDGPTYNFGSIPSGSNVTKTFTLSNAGGVTATAITGAGLASPFSYLGGTFPGTGGTCTSALAPSATCTVVGEFAPVAAGSFTSNIQIDFFDTLANQQVLRAVQGTGLNPALLNVNLGPTYDFGQVAVGGTKEQSFIVSNDGQFIASSIAGAALAAPFSYKGGTFPGTGGTCGATLNAAATCTVVAVYAPTVTGLQSGTLQVNYNNGAGAQSSLRAMQGTGAAAATLGISDGPLFDYGSIATGASADKSFTLTNSGGVTATAITGGGLAAPFSFKGGAYPGTGGTCAATLAVSANCTVVVTYAPTGTGLSTDAVDIGFFDGVVSQSVSRNVQGNAVPPANLTISDGPTYSFGSIPSGGVTEKTFTVTNSGTTTATAVTAGTLTAPFSFKGGFSPGTGGTCTATIAAAGTCTLVVQFSPMAIGTFSDSIQLTYSDGASARNTARAIDGVGTAAGQLTISDGPTYDYGSWPSGVVRDRTFTVTNSGGVAVSAMAGAGLAAPFGFKDGSYPGTGGTCAAGLAPSATCTVVVSFAPSSINTFNSTLNVTYNDGISAQSSARAVTGVGVPPGTLLISDGPTYDYGTVATLATRDRTFTVTNNGGFPTTAMAGAAIAAPFGFKGGSYPGTAGTCAGTLTASATCTIVVTYSPTTTGAHSGTVGITYNDGVGAQTGNRAVIGTGAAPALLALSDGPTYDFGTVAIGSSGDKSLTLSNSGGVSAVSISGGGLASPFSYKGGTFPGTGGTCGATLAAAATCTVTVTYTPVGVGTQNGTASVGYNDGVAAQTALRNLTGTGVPPGSIFISDGPTFDFTTVAIGAVAEKSFTVTNNGAFSATAITGSGLAAPFIFKGGTYPGLGGTCGTSLAPAATCTVITTFTPTAGGNFSDTLDIGFFDGSATQTSSRPMQGTGAAAALLAISDGVTYDFGTKATSSTTDKSFNVTNSGGVAATTVSGSGLVAPFTYKGGTFPGTGGTCGATIAASATCTIIVTYSPTGTGAHSSTINVSYTDGVTGQAATRPVTGFGATPALLTLSNGPTFDYGTVAAGGFLDQSFTVNNTGGVAASAISGGGLAAPYGFKGGSYPGTGGTCAATLAAAGTCTVIVTFAPTVGGASTDTIELSYNDGVAVQMVTRDLMGASVAPGQLSISDGPSYDFGAVPTTGTADKVFTVTNTGSIASTAIAGSGLTAPFTFKGGTFPGTGGTCGTSLNAAAACTVVATFSPTANGAVSQTMTLSFNDGAAAQTSSRTVQGTGAPPANITISDGATFNFGNLANGSTGEKVFTLTNSGGVTGTAMAGGALAAPYSFKGGTYPGTAGTCAATLAATATCTVVVVYSPTALGTQTATLSVDYHNGLSAQTATRAMTGTSVAPALLAFSDGPTYDYGIAAQGANVDKVFTITNSGAFTASVIAGAGVVAPYTFKGGTFPGTGGSCAATLPAGSTCLVVVTWTPTSTGVQTGTAQINYFDGAQNQSTTRPLTGTGAAPALLALSDGPTYDFGTQASGSSTDKSFTVTNTGGVTATAMSGGGLAAPYGFKGGAYPGTGGTCVGTLAVSGTCTVIVTFAPSVGGVTTDTLDVTYNNGASAQTATRDLTGTGTAPAILTISDGVTYDFGAVVLTGTRDKVFTITNTGNLSATTIAGTALVAPYSFKGGTFPGVGGDCGASLAPAATCLVAVTFAPTVLGSYSSSLALTYANGVGPVSSARPIQGIGASPANITISDGATFSFGNLANGSSGDKSFTLTNGGGVGATAMAGQALTAPYSYKGGTYPGSGGSCSATLASAATCTVVVSYSPTSVGTQTSTLSVDYTNGLSGQTASRPMTGTSVAPASLAFSDGPTYDFGTASVGGFVEKTFTITNSGSFTASAMTGGGFAAPFVFKGGIYPGTGGNCSTTLAAAGTCTVVVRWSPTATGLQTATGTLDYYDGALNQQASRPVQGSAAAAALLAISDGPTYDYGTQATGSVTEKSFIVTNTGGVVATAMSGSGLAAPFLFKGGSYPGTGATCGASLAAAGTCTVIATFSPTVTGAQSDTLDIGYNDGVTTQTASRALSGAGSAPAILNISDGATYDFGAVAVTGSADKIFTVSNDGNLSATSIVGSGLTLQFSYKGGTFPGVGGTCGSTLAPAASCTVAATFNPMTSGSFSSALTLDFNNGAGLQSSSRPVQGVGAAPASITISDGATYNYGSIANGASADKSFTLTNGGGVTATALAGVAFAAPYSFKGGTYPGTAGTCGVTLTAAATCTVVVTYSPTAIATNTATLSVNYTDGLVGQTASRALTGTAVAPAVLTISDGATYDYGTLAVGATLDKSFTITNSGAVTATTISSLGLVAPYLYKGGAFPGTGGTCTNTLNATATCTVIVTWSPTATGAQSGSVIVDYFDGAQSQTATRPVTGVGTAPALITVSDGPTFDYGSQATGSSTDKTFTLTNTGGNTAAGVSGGGLAVPFSYKGGTFPGTGGNCAATIAAAGTCNVVVTFAPAVSGPFSSTINIAYNNGVSAQNSLRAVQGVGLGPAVLTISDAATFDFGPVATTGSADKVFSLTNSGGLSGSAIVATALTAPYSFKGGTFPGTGGTCGATLAAAATCNFVVTFAPTANGATSATISLAYNDGASGQNATRGIQGAGAPPASITVSDGATYNFGTLANGGLAEKSFTLTNGGGVTATVMSGATLTAPYGFKGGTYPGTGGSCAVTLGVSATCTVVVVFSPTSIATHNSSVGVNYFDGLATQLASRAVTGIAVAPASLSISDGPTYDFGTLATGSTLDKTLTVTNGGSFAASAMSGSGLAAPYTFKGGSYPGTGGTCAATLSIAATCTVVVTYAPTGSGTHTSSANVLYNDGANSQTASRPVTGVGVAPSLLTISDGPTYSYTAAANGSVNDKSFTVTNSGGLTATAISGGGLTAPYTFKGGTYPGAGGSCGTSLAAAATCTVVVSFAPTITGTHTTQLDISFNTGVTTATASRPIDGISSAPATLTISDGATFNYGNVANGSVNDKTFTITNTGGFTASTIGGSGLLAPFTFKAGTFPGSGGTCSLTLAAGANCTVIVTFSPVASANHNGQFDIGYNNGVATQTSSRLVQGISTAPAILTISDAATYSFGSVAVTASGEKTFTISNSGFFQSSAMSGTGLTPPFTFKGGTYPGTAGTCAATLAASSTCTVVVVYAPTATGVQSQTLSVVYNDGAANQSADRPVTGTGVAPALITISNGPSHNFGSQATGSSTDQSFTLTNTGGLGAAAVSGGGLAAPFSFKGGSFPGTGGTCVATLAAAGTCTVIVTFAPTVNGAATDAIDITYNNGVSGQTSSRTVDGVGVGPALLTISDGVTYDYGPVATTGVAEKVFTVTNAGGIIATVITPVALSAPYAFKAGTFPGTGGTCGATLAPAATCTFNVTFSPTANGSASTTVTLNYNDGVAAAVSNRGVQGTGSPPALITVSDGATYSYGSIANGGVAEKTFTLTNGGGVTATTLVGGTIAAPYGFKGGTYPGTGGTCAGTLGVSGTCTIVVVYSPTSIGTQTGTASVNYFDGLTTVAASRALTGTATAPALLTINLGPTYDYGTLATGSSLDATFTITNGGNTAASSMTGAGLAAPFTFKGATYPGTGGTCGASLAVSGTCTIVVTWAPTATGVQSSTLQVNYFDGAQAQAALRPVTGNGVAPALLSISDGATYNFGAVANTSVNDKSFTVTNSGGLTATAISGTAFAAPFSFAGGTFPGTGGSCGTTLAAAGTCNVVVRFNPMTTNSYAATVTIGYNDGVTTQTALRPLTGSSNSPAVISISDAATFNFGNKANGSTTDKTFTVSNTGGVTGTAIAPVALTAPYSFKGGTYPGSGGNCGITLAASSNCSVVVTFAPTATSTHNQTLNLGYNDGVSTLSATRPMTGVSTPPAVLAISGPATYDFGTKATTTSTDATFTVTNSGSYDASTITPAGLSAPFSFKGGIYPGTGGTCAGTLAGGGSTCTVIVTYAPTTTGAHSGTITLFYNDGAAAQSAARPMQGVGASPATITISDGAIYDFTTVAVGNAPEKQFTLNNTGGFSATSLTGGGLAAPFSFKGGSYPGTGGTCGATLAAVSTCTIVVKFTPTVNGAYSDTIDVTFDNGITTVTSSRDVIGAAANPAVLTISDATTYSFGNKANGSSTDKSFTITNSGGVTASSVAPLALTTPYSFKGGTYPGSGGTCGVTIATGSCTVVVTFAPTASSTHNETLTINYNDGVTTLSATRPMTGVSTAPAVLAISGAGTYDYGTRATSTSTDATFTITNSGVYDASSMVPTTLTAPFSYKGGTYPGTAGTCAGTLAGGNSTCTIVVTYAPTGTGAHTDTITLNYNDGAAPQAASRPVQGTGVAPALLTVSDGPTYGFGAVANTSVNDKSFTVTNSGGLVATAISGSALAAPFSFAGGTFPGTGGNCATTLAAAGTCTIVVRFNPMTTNVYSDTVSISYNNGVSAQTATRPLTGSSDSPAVLTISDATTFNFGNKANGSTTDKTFTITNSGGVTGTSVAPVALTSPYLFKGGTYPGSGGTCGITLAAAGTCTVVVTYAPTVSATANQTLAINYNDGVSALSATRPMTGVSTAPASLTISGAGTYDYGTRVTTTSTDATFTITNAGSFDATTMTPAALTAPFSFKGGIYPGTGGTCAGTLAGGNTTCTVVVTYAPTATGSHSDSITLFYNDGAAAQSTARPVQGVGATAATITISDGPTYDFGAVAVGVAPEKQMTLTNAGGFPTAAMTGGGLAAPFSFKGGTYPGTGGTCTAVLAAAGTCTIVVKFTPSTNGSYTDTVDITYNNGLSTVTSSRDIAGAAANPSVLTISDGTTFDYGARVTGSSNDKAFTITNTGGVTATSIGVTGLAVPYDLKGGSFPGSGGSCGATLAGAATCTIVVTFAPTIDGSSSSNIALGYNDGVTTQTTNRGVQGSAAAAAVLTVSNGATYNFGNVAVGTNNEFTFTVTNSGGVPGTAMAGGTLTAPYAFKGGTYPGTAGTCSTSLASSSSCTVVVVYTPTAAGTQTDTVTVNYHNGLTSTSATRPVTGTALSAAVITVSDGPTYDFGTLPVTAISEKTFTLTNSGGFTASAMTGGGLVAPFTYKGGTYPGTGGTCSTSLNTLQACTIVVRYAPVTQASHSSSVSIGYSDGANAQTATRAVIGVGSTVASLTISDGPTYDYGGIANLASADKTFTVTNNGGVTATAMAGSGLVAPYSFKGGSFPGTGGNCGATLAGGSTTCTIVITFAPTVTNTHNATVSIGYNDGLAVQTATRGLTGTSYTAAVLAFNPTSSYSFGTLETGFQLDQTFTIENAGSVSATSMAAVAFTDAAFTFAGGTYPGTGATCGTILPGASSCTVKIRFLPSTTGVKADDVKINYYDGVVTKQILKAVSGTATAPNAPTLLTRLVPSTTYANTSTATIQVAGNVVGDTVRLFTDSICTAQVASGTVAPGNTTIDLTWNTISVDQTWNFYANRSNTAGSTSACSTSTVSFVRDTVFPIMTSIANFSPGVSPSYVAAPVMRVNGTFSSDDISIYSNAACTTLVTSLAAQYGPNVDITLPTIGAAGTYTYYAKAVDLAGNASSCTATPVTYLFDATDVTVTFNTDSQYVTENGGTVTVPVTMSSSKQFAVIVSYTTAGTAVNGTHTSGISSTGTVTIPASSTTANITFTLPNNGTAEKDKFLDISLTDSDYAYAHVAGKILHRVMILDDDQTATAPVAMPSGPGAGLRAACYITYANKLFCMGQGGYVGDGTSTDRATYVAVDASNNFSGVSIGYEHACAVTAAGGADAAGTIRCWGTNAFGQLGDNSTTTRISPISVTTNIGTGVLSVTAGSYHTCALSSTSKLFCWGNNSRRQVTGSNGADRTTPFALDVAVNYSAVSPGYFHTCAIQTTGGVMTCFGENADGKTGTGGTGGFSAVGTMIDVGVAYAQVVSGLSETCGRTTGNAIKCWGLNTSGRIGLGGTSGVTSPTAVDSGVSYSKISLGLENLCGVTTGNVLKCTGRVDHGTLFDRLPATLTSMTIVQSGTSFSDVSVAYNQSWARTTTQRVLQGGERELYSYAGDGRPSVLRTTASLYDGTRVFTSVDRGSGSSRATCAIAGGKLRCVGSVDSSGLLGIGSTPDVAAYTWVDAQNDYSMVASARNHMCAIRSNGKLFCAGNSAYNGANITTSTMVAVDSASNYSVIAAGAETTCAIVASTGVLKCWGENGNSQVGNNSTIDVVSPTIIDSGVSYSNVAVGFTHACGVTTGGVLKCWGSQLNGRQGDGVTTATNVGVPTTRDGGTLYSEVAAGESHTCGITTGGALKCWGNNADGRIGDGTTTQRTAPTAVDAGNTYLKVSAGDFNTCAVRSTGTVYCWGGNSQGVAGTSTANWTSPTAVDGATTYVTVQVGRYKACGRTSAGYIRCWGNNQYNAFGAPSNFVLPQAVPVSGFAQKD